MTGYSLVRAAHSDWRWVVLATLLLVLLRRGDWTALDERLSKAFVAAVDIQVALGLILYFGFSPFFLAAGSAFGAAMHDPITRFFSVEHETAMLIAFIIAHVGRVRIRRAEPGRKRRVALVTALLFLAVIAWAIPWPGRRVGRPLFRDATSQTEATSRRGGEFPRSRAGRAPG